MHAMFTFNGRSAHATLYIVRNAVSVMGKFQMKDLGVQFDWDTFAVKTVSFNNTYISNTQAFHQ